MGSVAKSSIYGRRDDPREYRAHAEVVQSRGKQLDARLVDGVQGSPLVEITSHWHAPFMPLQSDKDRIVAIEGIIAKLSDYREMDRDHAIRADFRAAIDWLGSPLTA
jgi:hypothetical protein